MIPVSDDLVELARSARSVGVIEDSLVGGVAGRIGQALADAGVDVPVHAYGIPQEFLDHGSRGQVLDRVGLTPDAVATSLTARLA